MSEEAQTQTQNTEHHKAVHLSEVPFEGQETYKGLGNSMQ